MKHMNVLFKDDILEQLEADSSFDGGFQSGVVKKYRMRMQYIRSAKDERDFYAMRSLRFEKLKGKRKEQYSIRVPLGHIYNHIARFIQNNVEKRA